MLEEDYIMIAILLAAPSISSNSLQVTIRRGADSILFVGWRDCQLSGAGQCLVICDSAAVRMAVDI
jgi:hypothetical protein